MARAVAWAGAHPMGHDDDEIIIDMSDFDAYFAQEEYFKCGETVITSLDKITKDNPIVLSRNWGVRWRRRAFVMEDNDANIPVINTIKRGGEDIYFNFHGVIVKMLPWDEHYVPGKKQSNGMRPLLRVFLRSVNNHPLNKKNLYVIYYDYEAVNNQ